MDKEKIKKALEETEELIKVVSEKYRTSAFPVVFQQILNSKEVGKDRNGAKDKKTEKEEEFTGVENNLNVLAKKAGTSVDKLDSVLEIKDTDFKLNTDVPGEDNTEQERKGTIIILTVRKICFGESEILALNLAKKLRNIGVTPDRNLVSALKKYKNVSGKKLVTLRGRTKRARKYVATPAGVKEGLNLIREISDLVDE